jgi:hypothetical protein
MSIANETTTKIGQLVRYAHELAFSVYFPFLLIWVNDARSGWRNNPGDRLPWVLQLQLLMTGGYHPRSSVDDSTLRIAFISLWAASAVTIFVLLRILARFSFTHVFLRTFAGIVAVVGFPLTCVYACPGLYAYRGLSLTLVEVVAALVCAFLYVSGSWPSKAPWGILLLVLHFAFWSWCAWILRYFPLGGVPLLWPGYSSTWHTLEAPQLIYPWLGFLASLGWGLYVRLYDTSFTPSLTVAAE